MCGRYTIYDTDELADRFDATEFSEELRSNYNVAPAQVMPVITEDASGRHIELMKWGLIPVWSKDAKMGYKLINARAESIFEKPMWRNVIKRKRCLIPATGFYEWKRQGSEKQPFFIHPKDEKMFSFAGIWETWHDTDKQVVNTYSIITTEPNKEMADIHNRMPVILHREDEASWISPTNDSDRLAIEAVLRPYEDNGLELFEVSRDVNTVRNNELKLMQPLDNQ